MGGKSVPGGGDGAFESKRAPYYQAPLFEGKTQMEVAGEIKISQAQVSRLEKMHSVL